VVHKNLKTASNPPKPGLKFVPPGSQTTIQLYAKVLENKVSADMEALRQKLAKNG
jgi:hypothetical protein